MLFIFVRIFLILVCLNVDLKAMPLEVFTHSLGGAAQLKDGNLEPMPGGGLRAFNLAVVQRLMVRLNQPVLIREVPLKRALQALSLPKAAVAFGFFRTPAREPNFYWIGPLSTDDGIFYQSSKKKDDSLNSATMRKVSVCAVDGSAYADYLKVQGFSMLEFAPSYGTCLRMLVAGRVRLAVIARNDLLTQLKAENISPDLICDTGHVLVRLDSYMAVSLFAPAEVRYLISSELKKFQASPEYEIIRKRYFPEFSDFSFKAINANRYQCMNGDCISH